MVRTHNFRISLSINGVIHVGVYYSLTLYSAVILDGEYPQQVSVEDAILRSGLQLLGTILRRGFIDSASLVFVVSCPSPAAGICPLRLWISTSCCKRSN